MVGLLLVLVYAVEQARFGKVRSDELTADRQTVNVPRRMADGGESCKVNRHGVEIAEVHRHRIIEPAAEFEGRIRRGRGEDNVHLGKGGFETVKNGVTGAAGLLVVGVVVTGGEGVGTDENTALYFGTEGFAAAAVVHVSQVCGVGAAVTVAHAVITREVRRGFRTGDDVVAGDSGVAVREIDVHQGRAEAFVGFGGSVDDVGHRRFEVAVVGTRQADADAGERTIEFLVEDGTRLRAGGGIARIVPGHAVQDEGEVIGARGEGTGLVKAGGVGNHAPARQCAVGWLDAGNAAPGSRLADGTAGVAAGGIGHEAGGNGSGGCAG